MPSRLSLSVLLGLTLVFAACGSSSNSNPQQQNPAPSVTAVAPPDGPVAGGTAITISGTGFVAGATVTVGGTAATHVSVVSATSITATTPAHAAGAVNVSVTNSDGQSSTQNMSFTYNPAPTVTAIAPPTGPAAGGTAVTITGTGFLTGAAVTIGGAPASVVNVASTSITATTPAHAAGAASVVVTNNDGQSGTLASGFTYNPPPDVTSISPHGGIVSGGTAVTIGGTGFVSGATVSIGGAAATGVTVVNSTMITATTAAHAAGLVDVTVVNPDGQSGTLTGGYTYGTPPTVLSVLPGSGPAAGGTVVTITGTGFVAGASVTIGGTAAGSVAVVNATTINAVTPAHAAGSADVVVTNANGLSGALSGGFTYVPGPTVGSVSPIDGLLAGGTSVTITGTGFQSGAGVTFGGAVATGVTVMNANTITATTPAHAAGTVAVTVTNPDAQSGTLAGGFIYTPGPTLTAITPNSMGSGTPSFLLTANGSNFTPASVVNFNSIALTTTYVSSTQITGIVPAADIPVVGSAPVTVSDAGVTSPSQLLIIRNPITVAKETLSIPGLNRPNRIAFAPDGSLFIAEQGTFGSSSTADILRVVISGGAGSPVTWASLPVNPGNTNFGLLGMALDPKNPPTTSGGNIYIFYTAGTGVSDADNRIATVGIGAIAPTDLITGLPVAAAPDPLSLNGGKIAVYPNTQTGTSWLFVSTGGSDQTPSLSQTASDLHGKILRYNTDGSIPADNPFGASDPTYVCGFRNSLGFDFHPTAGTLYADDNGNAGLGSFPWLDSLDRALAGDAEGYGFTSSAHCQSNITNPSWTGPSPVIAPTGMIFYTGPIFPQLQNSVLMVGNNAILGARQVYQFEVDEYGANPGQLVPTNPAPLGIMGFKPSGSLSDIAQGPDGCVYIADSINNAIYRLKPSVSSPCK